jgi:hypothetical protein
MLFNGWTTLREREKGFDVKKISFLDAFAKLRKANISIVMSLRPPARPTAWNNSVPADGFS